MFILEAERFMIVHQEQQGTLICVTHFIHKTHNQSTLQIYTKILNTPSNKKCW